MHAAVNLLEHLPAGWGRYHNPCPRCHHRSLQVREHSFLCWYCGWRGRAWEFFTEILGQSPQALKSWDDQRERSYLYSQVFDWLQEDKEPARRYLESRGIDPDCYPFGYCPPGLLESRLTREALTKWGLASERGYCLLSGRVVFPVFHHQRIVHFQGRSLGNDTLRWCSTVGAPAINQYLFNAQRWQGPIPLLFVCEGIMDALTLLSLGLPAVATFGIYPPFALWRNVLAQAEALVLCYDTDRHPLGHPQAGQYISWPPVLQQFSRVYRHLPGRAYVLLPKGKDINEWRPNADAILEAIAHAPTVEAFALAAVPWPLQVQLLAAGKDPDAIAAFRQRWQDGWWEELVAWTDTFT